MEESSKSGEGVKCGVCGRTLKSIKGMGSHMRTHTPKPGLTQQPPGLPFITLPGQSITPQPFSGQTPSPPSSAQPQLDPSLLLGLLSGLLGGRKPDPAEEAFREAYTKFIRAVAELPSSFMLGMQSGLKDAVKSYVKEELKEVRSEVEKFIKEARAQAVSEGSVKRGGEKVEGER